MCVGNNFYLSLLDREVFFFLFAMYLDGLLVELSKSGVGCHWGSSFDGAFSYADDIYDPLSACAQRGLL